MPLNREGFLQITETPEGDFFMTIRIHKSELEFISAQIVTSKLSDIVDQCVAVLRDRIVERVQPDVLAKIDLPTIVNLANIRTGVALGDRLASETTKKG